MSLRQCILAAIAGFIAPVFAPLGFGDWRIVTALIAGFMAKESVVSTLSVLLESDAAITALISPLVRICAACILSPVHSMHCRSRVHPPWTWRRVGCRHRSRTMSYRVARRFCSNLYWHVHFWSCIMNIVSIFLMLLIVFLFIMSTMNIIHRHGRSKCSECRNAADARNTADACKAQMQQRQQTFG